MVNGVPLRGDTEDSRDRRDAPPNRSLYAIGSDLERLRDVLDASESGEIDPRMASEVLAAQADAWFAALEGEEAAKLDRYCEFLSEQERLAEVARLEAETWKRRATIRSNRAAWLREQLLRHLARTGRKRIQTEKGRTLRVCANGGAAPVVVDRPDELPEEYRAYSWKPDTDKLRKALEQGEVLPAHLGERGTHLRIG